MCGIFGSIASSEEVLRSSVDSKSIHASLRRRGPDGHGEYVRGRVLLAHSRLSILDLSQAAAQPFEGRRWVLSFNGEIFNFRSLRHQLSLGGARFKGTGDTEVLHTAIEVWGIERAIESLAGMFAIVALDKATGDLWAARDRLGIKPLYVHSSPNIVAFASWPSTLLDGLRQDWKLDRSGVERLFSFGATFGTRTLVEQISEVQPAHLWRIQQGKDGLSVQTERYWEPKISERSPGVDEFVDFFHAIVQEHMESDVPLALLASGGVDSTALASAMGRGTAFHLQSAEEVYARNAASACGLEFRTSRASDTKDWLSFLTEFSSQTGGAFGSSRQPLTTSRAIVGDGFKVALSGNGGDELFLGYGRTPIPDLPANGYSWLGGPRPDTASSAEAQIRHIFTSRANFTTFETPYSEVEAIDRLDLIDHMQRLNECRSRVGEAAGFRLFELETYVASDLNVTLDHASMFWSLEMRVPFLDHRVVEYALSMPASEILSDELGRKAPLKRLMDAVGVPRKVWDRPKLGFSLPVDDVVAARTHELAILTYLRDEGYLEYLPRKGLLYRDYRRVLGSALAFKAWKSAWIDTGRVAV